MKKRIAYLMTVKQMTYLEGTSGEAKDDRVATVLDDLAGMTFEFVAPTHSAYQFRVGAEVEVSISSEEES